VLFPGWLGDPAACHAGRGGGRRGGGVSGDRLIRVAAAVVVCAVAGLAAVVSYTHIYDLGRVHGQ